MTPAVTGSAAPPHRRRPGRQIREADSSGQLPRLGLLRSDLGHGAAHHRARLRAVHDRRPRLPAPRAARFAAATVGCASAPQAAAPLAQVATTTPAASATPSATPTPAPLTGTASVTRRHP